MQTYVTESVLFTFIIVKQVRYSRQLLPVGTLDVLEWTVKRGFNVGLACLGLSTLYPTLHFKIIIA